MANLFRRLASMHYCIQIRMRLERERYISREVASLRAEVAAKASFTVWSHPARRNWRRLSRKLPSLLREQRKAEPLG